MAGLRPRSPTAAAAPTESDAAGRAQARSSEAGASSLMCVSVRLLWAG